MKRTSVFAGAVAMLCCAAHASAQADPPGDALFGLAQAQAMADRALRTAGEKHLDVAIVVVNREGRVILSQRMDRASFLNLALAERKAATAAATGVQTSLLEQAVDGGKMSLLSVPGAAMIGGGVPVIRGDRIVGGVGVSGGSAQDDESIAQSALGAGR